MRLHHGQHALVQRRLAGAGQVLLVQQRPDGHDHRRRDRHDGVGPGRADPLGQEGEHRHRPGHRGDRRRHDQARPGHQPRNQSVDEVVQHRALLKSQDCNARSEVGGKARPVALCRQARAPPLRRSPASWSGPGSRCRTGPSAPPARGRRRRSAGSQAGARPGRGSWAGSRRSREPADPAARPARTCGCSRRRRRPWPDRPNSRGPGHIPGRARSTALAAQVVAVVGAQGSMDRRRIDQPLERRLGRPAGNRRPFR